MSAGGQGRLAGKRALVTAAAQGIGEAIASEGASVLATGADAETLSKLDPIEGIDTRGAAVLDGGAVNACVADAGPFVVLASCTGFVHHRTIPDRDIADGGLTLRGAGAIIRAGRTQSCSGTSESQLQSAAHPGTINRGTS